MLFIDKSLPKNIIKLLRGLQILVLVLSLLGITFLPALAQGSWGDDFDSYPINSQLHGVAGWKGWENNPAFGALVSNTQSRSSPHAIDITGNADLVQEYSGHTSGQWVYTAWQYIPNSYTGEGYFILLNTYNDGGAKSWSVQVHFRSSNNRVISDYDGNFLPMVRGRWVELRVEINLDTDRQTFYYDDQILYQNKIWSTGVSGSGQTAIEAVDLYANNSSPIYYDDLSLKSASATNLTSAANPSEFGSDVSLTATITSLSTLSVTPSGTVEFYEGATFLGNSSVDASGQANILIPGLGVGSHTITANYSGDVNYAPSSDTIVQDVVDTTPPIVGPVNSYKDTGDGTISPGEITSVAITQLLVTFSEDVQDPIGNTDPDDVTNPNNYSLILDPSMSATPISIDSVGYSAASRTATINLNGGVPLDTGSYQFTVRGTPSIQDNQGNRLDGNGDGTGGDDYTLDFRILPDTLPETGFPPGVISSQPVQSEQESFTDLDLRLIIPKLHKEVAIVGVPLTESGWNISWLGNAAGYLEGTAFPTWQGNTILTGHVYLPSGLPGPFVNIGQLSYGDEIQITAWGLVHQYTVVDKVILDPRSPEAFAHADRDLLTLVTCRSFDPDSGLYRHRILVRAVLTSLFE